MKTRFSVSWQVVPREIEQLMIGGTADQSELVMGVLMTMKKLDLAMLQSAFAEA